MIEKIFYFTKLSFYQGNADGFSLTQYHIYNGTKGWQDFINSSSETMQLIFFNIFFALICNPRLMIN